MGYHLSLHLIPMLLPLPSTKLNEDKHTFPQIRNVIQFLNMIAKS